VLAVSVPEIAVLFLAASLVGLSKTALPGAGTITVAVFAAVLPARESTGVLLVLLILGDLFAVRMYHAHADWRTLRRMVPAVLVGVVGGAAFLAVAGDDAVRRLIAVILLVLVAVTLARRYAVGRATAPAATSGTTSGTTTEPVPGWRRRLDSGVYGALAGFTTMVANAGGPVMSMYLLAARFQVNQFLGTAAWFFFVVNVCKVPFSIGLGLISGPSLLLDLVLAPAVVVGALLGRRVARRIDQRLFDTLVLVLTVASALYLLV
jgi:uncharacterized membrane protein YfcA